MTPVEQTEERAAFTLDLFKLDGFDLTNDDRERIAAYLAAFADTRDDSLESGYIVCPGCDSPRNVSQTAIMLGSHYTWGITHGELVCTDCGWPARVMHSVPLDNGQVFSWQMVMPAMPAAEAQR